MVYKFEQFYTKKLALNPMVRPIQIGVNNGSVDMGGQWLCASPLDWCLDGPH